MARYYAQINKDNICVGVSQLLGEVNLPNMIPLDEPPKDSNDLLQKRYDNGVWVEVPKKPKVEKITDFEQVQLDILLNLEYLSCLSENEN